MLKYTFLEAYKKKLCKLEDIDIFVEYWADSSNLLIPLQDDLGFKWEDYCDWTLHPSHLKDIVKKYN